MIIEDYSKLLFRKICNLYVSFIVPHNLKDVASMDIHICMCHVKILFNDIENWNSVFVHRVNFEWMEFFKNVGFFVFFLKIFCFSLG